MNPPKLPLFVFGTLRSGECNHALLEGRFDKRLLAVLDGYTRVGCPPGYLMIDLKQGTKVSGELFFLSQGAYEQTMTEIDELEMLPPGKLLGEWYERITVMVSTSEGDFSAWAYVKPRPPAP